MCVQQPSTPAVGARPELAVDGPVMALKLPSSCTDGCPALGAPAGPGGGQALQQHLVRRRPVLGCHALPELLCSQRRSSLSWDWLGREQER